MGQLTIRNIDPEIEQTIRQIAKAKGQSLNQVIKEIIYKEFKSSESPAASLKQLAGNWTQKEAAEFELSIQSCEKIDKDMWE
jgi:plasmid stability protein